MQVWAIHFMRCYVRYCNYGVYAAVFTFIVDRQIEGEDEVYNGEITEIEITEPAFVTINISSSVKG